MQRGRQHPLFSVPGCGTTVVMILGLGTVVALQGGMPFSPGGLTSAASQNQDLAGFSSHTEFEAECDLCHEPWRGSSGTKCMTCHTEISDQRVLSTGLHGRLPDISRCQGCHTEHKGPAANITTMALSSFDHDGLTPFSLMQHQQLFDGGPFTCESCHLGSQLAAEGTDCVLCHRQGQPQFVVGHTALFGTDCLSCHDGRDSMTPFDHDTVFILEGAHQNADCSSCHIQRLFAGTPRDCQSCHREPAIHAGLFGLECDRCHSEVAWQPAQLTQHTFPLEHGGEGKIDCAVCHTATYTDFTCYNCHAHDPAEIREEHVDEGIFEYDDCIACHPTGHEDDSEGHGDRD